MHNKKAFIPKHSVEVQEIIGNTPSWILRSGTTAVFSVLLVITLLSWFIKYPDILVADVIITTSPSPETLVSKNSGSITLVRHEGETVQSGELVAFINTNALPQAVLDLEISILGNNFLQKNPVNGALGDLEPYYSKYLSDQVDLRFFERSKAIDIQIQLLSEQASTLNKIAQSMLAQNGLLKRETVLGKEKFQTDSILFEQGVIAATDYNESQAKYIQQQRVFQNEQEAILNNELQRAELRKQIMDLTLAKSGQLQKLKLSRENSRKELLAAIARWKDTNLFISKITGKIAYLGVIENNTFIELGKPVVTIIPTSNTLCAKAELPIQGSGKVKQGQQVHIQLANYPYEQFGIVDGMVTKISLVPNEGKYFITITLPNGLRTNQNITLPFRQQLSGTTQIITDDVRLFQRFFYGFKRLINVNR